MIDFSEELLTASNPETNAETLDSLSSCPSKRVRRKVAVHLNTAASTAAKMVTDPDWIVRFCLASRSDLPPDALSLLEKDVFPCVRIRVFSRLDIDVDTLSRGAKDRNPDVRTCVVNHSLASQDILAQLSLDRDRNVASLSRERLRRLHTATKTT